MSVCQTCGDEGFSKLLIPCDQCHIAVVHRYCVDGPPNIDDDEVSWSCEDCVPRIPEPVPAIRKSERIFSISDREVQRRKARRNWRNHLSVSKLEKSSCLGKGVDKVVDDEKKDGIGNLKENDIVLKDGRNHLSVSKVEKSNCVGKRANKVVDDSSNLDEKVHGIISKTGRNHSSVSEVGKPIVLGLRAIVVDASPNLYAKKSRVKQKQGKVVEKGAASKKRGSEPDSENKKTSDSFLSTGKGTTHLKNQFTDGEGSQTKPERNLVPQLSNGPELCLEGNSKADLISDGQSLSNLHSNLLDEHQVICCSEAAKRPDATVVNISGNFEATNAVSASHQRCEKQSGFSVYELQTPRKKRKLIIAMEYSDSDEEPTYVRHAHTLVSPNGGKKISDTSSSGPRAKNDEYSLTEKSSLKSDDCSLTQPSPMHTDSHMLTQTSSIDFKNHDPAQLPSVAFDSYIHAQPMTNAVWRGHCTFSNDKHSMSFGLEARLSSQAHAFVHGVASALPNSLHFEIVQKHYAWPKRFQDSPPKGDAIGLYFFPVEERDEKWYTCLLDEMIECDLVLKSHINNLELLIFSSLELPLQERRYQSKYYMWGVFKQRQETSSTRQPSCIQISDTRYVKRDLAVPGINRNSVSPSSVDNYSATNSSNSHLHHKAGNRVEFSPNILLKHPKAAYNEEDYNSQPKTSAVDSLTRSNNPQYSRNLSKPQEHAHKVEVARIPYHGGDLSLCKRNPEIRQSTHSHSSCKPATC